MTGKQKKKADRIAAYYGLKRQTDKAVEELDELWDDLTSHPTSAPVEEIADVYVMLYQLRKLHNISDDEISQWIDYKLKRQIKRIEDEVRC